jgi:uncharacterized Fe-S cluster-containing radical SAM superfamily protein
MTQAVLTGPWQRARWIGTHGESMLRLSRYLKFMIRSGVTRILPGSVVATGVEWTAALRGKRFSCSHLFAGDELCINSDMTVACSCLDEDQSTVLGSLTEHGLADIAAGPIARRFREELARGRLPVAACRFCPGLQIVDEARVTGISECSLAPRSIFVENTVSCNLHCTSCPRTTLLKRSQTGMSLEDIRNVARAISQYRVQNVWFYNWGEPFLSPTIDQELRVLRDLNPNVAIRLSTNGLLVDSDKKRDAALLTNHVMFSIFGSTQESLVRYQRGGNFERSFTNMKELVRYRDLKNRASTRIEWKYVLFRWNDSEELIRRAIELAAQAGVDVLSFRLTALPGRGISYRFFLSDRLRRLMETREGMPNIELHGDGGSTDLL